MIQIYFADIEKSIQAFPNIRSYAIRKKVYNRRQGYIGASILFEDGCRLDFIEVKDVEQVGKIKYRYQYMDKQLALIFRYDNAPHHKNSSTFPHHKHIPGEIQESSEPILYDILLEIAYLERKRTG